jgi:hypothetical protein
MTYFRVQSADRNVADLLDPGYQFSHAWSGDSAHDRVGVSVCDDVEDLAMYLASHLGEGIEVHEGSWVLVELEADVIQGSRPIDPEFEILVRPTEIVAITPVGDDFLAMVDEANTELTACFHDSTADFDD